MNKDLLLKYLNNQCSDTELAEVLRWVKEESLNESSRNMLFDFWDSVQLEEMAADDESFMRIFDKVQTRITEDDARERKGAAISSMVPLVLQWVTRAAAVLLLPVLGLLIYTLADRSGVASEYAGIETDSLEVISPLGARTVVELSDGTEVQLNYGSKLKYPHFFSGNTREVRLSGEGYFNVSHNPKKPFIVRAGSLHVKAVGTSFNVMAYPGQGTVATTLVTGKVILEQEKADGGVSRVGEMTPGLHVNYNLQTGTLTGEQGSVAKYTSWTEGKLIFEDTPIQELTARLSRRFNVDFVINKEIQDYKYTVTFTDEDQLTQILDLMTIATPITYTMLARRKNPDGTFTRPEIVLERRE